MAGGRTPGAAGWGGRRAAFADTAVSDARANVDDATVLHGRHIQALSDFRPLGLPRTATRLALRRALYATIDQGNADLSNDRRGSELGAGCFRFRLSYLF